MINKNFAVIFFLFFMVYCCAHEYSEFFDLVKKYIPENPVILEAGARYGNDTKIMAQLWPDSIIHTFEPVPWLFHVVQKNVDEFEYVYLYKLALSDKNGTAEFYECTNNHGAGSLLPPTKILQQSPDFKFKKKPSIVRCLTLDDWAYEHNVDHIDFMWLDIEGHELAVLKVSPQLFSTVKALYTEVNFKEFRAGTPHYDEVKSWLEQQGFELVYKKDIGPWENGVPWQANVLFVRS